LPYFDTAAQFFSNTPGVGPDLAVENTYWLKEWHATRDSLAEPGSYWRIVPPAASNRKRQQVNGPIRFASLAVAPDPTAHPGLHIYLVDLGIELISNGTVYRPIDWEFTLYNLQAALSRAAGSSPNIDVEWQPAPIQIPRDINGKSLLRDNDFITIYNAHASKAGTTDKLRVAYRMGSNNSLSDTELIGSTNANVTGLSRWARDIQIRRHSNNQLQFRGQANTNFLSGESAVAFASLGASIAGLNLDGAETYFNIGVLIIKSGGSIVDTAINLDQYHVKFCKGSI
jgi:hypothetical protein